MTPTGTMDTKMRGSELIEFICLSELGSNEGGSRGGISKDFQTLIA